MSLAWSQRLASGASVKIILVVVDEVGATEGAVDSLRFVEDRNMRFDAFLIYQPAQHFGCAVGGVGGQLLGVQAEALIDPVNHGTNSADFGLANGT